MPTSEEDGIEDAEMSAAFVPASRGAEGAGCEGGGEGRGGIAIANGLCDLGYNRQCLTEGVCRCARQCRRALVDVVAGSSW